MARSVSAARWYSPQAMTRLVGSHARPECCKKSAQSYSPKQNDNDLPLPLHNLYCAVDAFALAVPEVANSLRTTADTFVARESVDIFDGSSAEWLHSYQILQGYEIWETLGRRLATKRIALSETIAERFAQTRLIDDENLAKARQFRDAASERLIRTIPRDVAIVIPSSPTVALKKSATKDETAAFYATSLTLNSIAGHAGLPQVCIPAGTVDGCPVSLSLIGRAGDDIRLIATASLIAQLIDSCENDTL